MIETSALTAILLEEPDWQQLVAQITAETCFTTSVVIFETTLALSRHRRLAPTRAHEIVVVLAERLLIEVVDVTAPMIAWAALAREKYGAGANRLNMGDCLSYGAAKLARARLLYKGDDFPRTDVNENLL